MAWQKRYVVRKADHVDGPPIPEDEPCLVIRAQDALALAAMDHYIALYRAVCSQSAIPGAGSAVLEELDQHREAIVVWQAEHRTKFADR